VHNFSQYNKQTNKQTKKWTNILSKNNKTSLDKTHKNNDKTTATNQETQHKDNKQKSNLYVCTLSRLSFSLLSILIYHNFIIIPPPQNVCGGLYWIRFVASVGRSVCRSVGPSPILVRSITPLLMEGFPSNLHDTFTSTRGCAELMSHMCQLKVKVTVKGQIFNKHYYTLCRVRFRLRERQYLWFMSCLLNIIT